MAHIHQSAVIPAPVAEVWAVIRDFNGLPDWTPFVADSMIEEGRPADQIGCIRHFHLKDGGLIRERLLALSDIGTSCTYSILESPLGVENYVATLSLIPITATGESFAQWVADFDADPAREAAIASDIASGVFATGLAALAARFRG